MHVGSGWEGNGLQNRKKSWFDSNGVFQVCMSKWPTLAGRLNQPPTSELEALEQLARSMPLSPLGQKRLERLRKKSRKNKKLLDYLMRVCYSVARKMKIAQEILSENKNDKVFISMNGNRQHKQLWFSIKSASALVLPSVSDYNRPEGAGC